MRKVYLRPKMKIRGKRRKKLDTVEGVLRVYYLPTVWYLFEDMDDRYAKLAKYFRRKQGKP